MMTNEQIRDSSVEVWAISLSGAVLNQIQALEVPVVHTATVTRLSAMNTLIDQIMTEDVDVLRELAKR
jgi:hypothetical protein